MAFVRTYLIGSVFFASLVGLGFLASACGSGDDSCEDTLNCGNGGGGTGASGGTGSSGGTGATGGVGGDGGCDLSKSPTEEACLVSDQYAIFVSPTGAAGADGTKAAPLKSITEAVTKAAGGKVIVVCNGTYDEHVLINAGAKIYGGFDCGTWASTTGTKPKVAPADVGYALEVDSVADEVVVENIEFVAKDGALPGESSVALFVHESLSVSLSDVRAEAGDGVTGDSGVLDEYEYPTQAQLNGNAPQTTNGGATKTCCEGIQTIGGQGGNAIAPNGQSGTDGGPSLGAGQGGTAKMPVDCSQGIGKNGANASPTTTHGAGATLGSLVSSGWTPGAGTSGKDGSPGQGGGGGASTAVAAGGGGGCGGCGGAGGPSGKGGGASIALLVQDSTVSVDNSDLVSKNAGDGGAGASGQTAQQIYGFFANGTPPACSGGSGGMGADGESGGGGAGGISVAIAYKGRSPVTTNVNQTIGAKGSAGLGGTPGTNDGADGVAEKQLLLP